MHAGDDVFVASFGSKLTPSRKKKKVAEGHDGAAQHLAARTATNSCPGTSRGSSRGSSWGSSTCDFPRIMSCVVVHHRWFVDTERGLTARPPARF